LSKGVTRHGFGGTPPSPNKNTTPPSEMKPIRAYVFFLLNLFSDENKFPPQIKNPGYVSVYIYVGTNSQCPH